MADAGAGIQAQVCLTPEPVLNQESLILASEAFNEFT